MVCVAGGRKRLFLPADDRARSRSLARALSLCIYIFRKQSSSRRKTAQRALSLCIYLYITYITLKYMRMFVPSGKTNGNLSCLSNLCH